MVKNLKPQNATLNQFLITKLLLIISGIFTLRSTFYNIGSNERCNLLMREGSRILGTCNKCFIYAATK